MVALDEKSGNHKGDYTIHHAGDTNASAKFPIHVKSHPTASEIFYSNNQQSH